MKAHINTKIEVRKIPTHRKGTLYEARMMTDLYVWHFLKKITRGHKVLNLFSGISDFGDIRVDIKPHQNVTLVGDVFELLSTWKDHEFDYIFMDPDFRLYNPGPNSWNLMAKYGFIKKTSKYYGHPFEWQYDVFDKCRIGMISRRELMQINMEGVASDTDIILATDSRPAATIYRFDWQ